MTDQSTVDAKKVTYKTELLVKLGLAASLASAFGARVHMIRPAGKAGGPHRIMCIDGGWIEIDPTGRTVRTWGPGRTAREIAAALKTDGLAVENLEPAAAAAAPGAPDRAAPMLTDSQAKTLVERWRARGFDDVIEDERGVWVGLRGGTKLFDTGDRVRVYGPISDQALTAIVEKAKADWGGGLQMHGRWPDRDEARLWLACQRAGVEFAGYVPSPALLARWEAEQEAAGCAGQAMRPDAAMAPSAGPVPPKTAGPAVDPVAPDLSAFDRQAASLDRRAIELGQRQLMTIKDQTAFFQRTERLDLRAAQARVFEEIEERRQVEGRIAEAREILARARALAVEKGLAYDAAIALARAELLAEQEHDHRPQGRFRR